MSAVTIQPCDTLDEAIAQVPAPYHRNVLVTVDGAGAFHNPVGRITIPGGSPWRTVHYRRPTRHDQ